MTQAQILAIISPIVAAVGAMAVSAGYINASQLTLIQQMIVALVPAGLAIAAVVAAFRSSSPKSQVASVAAMPDVSRVVMTSDAAAASHPATNVVGPAS